MKHEDLDILRLATDVTASDVAAAAEQIYGPAGGWLSSRLLHVTAVWQKLGQDSGAGLVTLRITPETPRCLHDTFALYLARARADVILTSGKIVREEPELRQDLAGLTGDLRLLGKALAAWRREVLGKEEPPTSLILTSGRGLDFEHPIFRTGPCAIYTGLAGEREHGGAARARGVRLRAEEEPSLEGALAFAREMASQASASGTVLLEAGPSTTAGLYGEAAAVDELMLSIFEAPELPEGVEGGDFLPPERLEALFTRRSPGHSVVTTDGVWRFYRLRR